MQKGTECGNKSMAVQGCCPYHYGVRPELHLRCLHTFIILDVSQGDKKRSTELWSLDGLERVEVMIMRWSLRWLGYVESETSGGPEEL